MPNKHARERAARALARKKAQRLPYPRVLIVCEGAKTEPLYFEDIRIQNRVSSAHIKIMHSEGTQPRQVVDFAETTFKKSKEYDWVFAVFDRDSHLTYHDALARAKALDYTLNNDERKKVRFLSVPSVPCFELWLLIHFVEVYDFADRFEVMRRLRGHVAGYEKGSKGIYATTEPNLIQAIERAKKLQARFSEHSGTEPYTRAHEVVQLLRTIRGPER